MKKYKIITLGCKVNTYESQVMKEALDKNDYQETEENDCDVVIINTCAVTGVASSKSRKQIHKARRENPNAILIAVGCFVQCEYNSIKNDDINIYLGTRNKSKVVEYINDYLKDKQTIVDIDDSRKRTSFECMSIDHYNENTRAFVKIQDGCDNFCSYCFIPYTRGKFVSRKKNEILFEIHNLVKNGYKEIVLTGIDTASYGKDINESFVSLLKEILNQEKDLKRLRISSIEASQIDDDFIELLVNEERIARHLHIPLQSGSKTVLKRMNRKYLKEDFLNKIIKIRDRIPNIALACDIIEGFPQETKEEFYETKAFVEQCGFNYLHVFPYSIRPGTVASRMKPQVPYEIKKERTLELIALGKELENNYYQKFENQVLEVLFESVLEDGKTYKGYSSNYIPVTVVSKENLTNKMIEVKYHYNKLSEILN